MTQRFWLRLIRALVIGQASIVAGAAIALAIVVEICRRSEPLIADGASLIVSIVALAEIALVFWAYGHALEATDAPDDLANIMRHVPAQPWIVSHGGRTYPFSRN